MTKGRKLDFVPKPSPEEIRRIKDDLRLRSSDPLPRCMGQNVKKRKELGGEHLEPGHLCDECRCSHTAGHGTDHYGYGYCIYHENGVEHKGHALDVAHSQRLAVQQGHPAKVYQYLSGIEHIDDIREAAEHAKGRHQLKEEIVVLKAMLQRILTKLGDMEYVESKDVNAVTNLTRTIATLAKTELEITDSDYIHVDQLISWFAAILRIIDEGVEDPQLSFDLKAAIAEVPQPKKGKQ